MSSSSESSSEDELAKKMKEDAKKKKKNLKKRRSEASEEPEEVPAKKSKPEKAEPTGRPKDSDGNEMYEFGNLRYVTVSNFKGKEYVNIREYYIDKNNGKMMPSRKGISLNKAQWANLKDLIPEIDRKI